MNDNLDNRLLARLAGNKDPASQLDCIANELQSLAFVVRALRDQLTDKKPN